jgi:hypothetical protein
MPARTESPRMPRLQTFVPTATLPILIRNRPAWFASISEFSIIVRAKMSFSSVATPRSPSLPAYEIEVSKKRCGRSRCSSECSRGSTRVDRRHQAMPGDRALAHIFRQPRVFAPKQQSDRQQTRRHARRRSRTEIRRHRWAQWLLQLGGYPKPTRSRITSSKAISCGQVTPSARATWAAACAT